MTTPNRRNENESMASPSRTDREPLPLDVRVARVETRLGAIEDAVIGIAKTTDGLREAVAALARTNWPVIIGIGGPTTALLLGIGGLLYTFHGTEIGRIEGSQQKIAAQVDRLRDDRVIAERDASYHRGRTDQAREQTVADITGVKAWVKEVSEKGLAADELLDDRLQREMRDLLKINQTSVDALDTRLQGEITRSALERHEQINTLKAAVDDIADFQRETAGIHANLSARVGALERKP